MTKINEIIKVGILSALITFVTGSILVVGGFSAQQHVYARPNSGGSPGVTGLSGGMGGDAGTGTNGGACSTANCNANGASQNGGPGTAFQVLGQDCL